MDRLSKVFVRVVLRHPVLAVEALRLALATATPGWLLKPPFLPRPGADLPGLAPYNSVRSERRRAFNQGNGGVPAMAPHTT